MSVCHEAVLIFFLPHRESMAALEAMVQNEDDTFLSEKEKPSLVAQHILSIVEDCFSQVEFAVTLPVCGASVHADDPFNGALQAHKILEKRFVSLKDVKQESEEEQGKMSAKAGSREKRKLRQEIKKSVKDILRLFKPHLSVLPSLRVEQGVELSQGESSLIRELKIYQSLVAKRLTSEPEWPVQNMQDLNSQEEQVAATLKQVIAEFSRLSEEINGMQSYIDPVEVETVNQPITPASDTKLTSSRDEIDKLNIHLYNLMHANKQAEMEQLKKNEILEGKIEDLLHKFDKNMEEIQAKLELNTKEYDEVLKDMTMLEKPFQALQLECDQIHEKHRLAEEKKKEEIRELELKTKASVIVQAWWRGCSTRKALKNKDKGKKKGKTKKGKGKKTK
uniref:Dynein regulatory complex protein 10 n=1 Tax=Oryzias melastigma TaxID=30732 RepID=A0A3B3D065_ORYME